MTRNTHSDRIDQQPPLTEEEHEEAPPELQIRNLIELKRRHDAFDRDDVELKFKMKVGRPPEGRNLADNRTFIELYDSPAGWIYHYDSIARERVDITDTKPPYDIFVEDSERFIKHAVEENNMDLEDACVISHSDSRVWNDLASKVRNDIQEMHGD
jgi:hypothetical protein